MANELLVSHTTGVVVYAVIRVPLGTTNIGYWFNMRTLAFEAWNPLSWVDYDIVLTELGTTGLYEGDLPAGPGVETEDDIEVIYLERAGANPVMTDTKITGSLFHQLHPGWMAVETLRV